MLKHLAYCKYQNLFLLLLPKINLLRITTLFLLFFSNSALAQQQLPSCKTLPQFLTGKAKPGVNCLADCNAMPSGITANNGINCLYDCNNMPSGNLPVHGHNCAFKVNGFVMPLCNYVPSITNPLNTKYVITLGITKIPRENCADLIDLPLCNLFSSGSNNKQNCVKKCSELSPATLIQRVHNRDCIRFCNEPEPDASNESCSALKCHHYINTGNKPPTTPTCSKIKCTNLTKNELNKGSIYSQALFSNDYCLNDNECLLFNVDQLSDIKTGYDSITSEKTTPQRLFCQFHNCRAEQDSSCAPYVSDDIAKIEENSAYKQKYYQAIFQYEPDDKKCLEPTCRQKILARYPCTGTPPNNPATQCPTTSTCVDSVCSFEVDCNSPQTSNEHKESYCSPRNDESSQPTDHSNSYLDLVGKTWFYLPKPMNKSYKNDNPSDGYREMNKENLCYTPENLKDSGFGRYYPEFNGLCYFFERNDFAFDHNYISDTRSPNVCESPKGKFGNRGTSGWMDICGSRSFTSLPDKDNLGYIDNISSYWQDESAIHKVRVCIRYDNGMIPDRTCGARECGITCTCGTCSSVCGTDVCREVTISDSNLRECEDPSNSSDKPCVASLGYGADLDSYMRVRAVGFKEDNSVCVMFDWKGGLAYNPIFMNGTESLREDNTKCLAGTYNPTSKTCTGGKNSNDDPGLAHVWRAVGLIKYIDQNVTVGGVKGIKDVYGNFFKEASCIKRQLRSSPPNLFNLANYDNSPNLFNPPLIINKAKRKKDGEDSNPLPGELFGSTDFNEPEVEILYGTKSEKLSLSIGKNGNETGSDSDPNSKKTISVEVFGRKFEATVYAKKLYDPLTGPKFCVFRELKDKYNNFIDPPPTIGCVKRNPPELDNCDSRDGLCTAIADRNVYRRKFLLSKDNATVNDLYNKIIVKYRYLVNYGNAINDTSCNPSNKCSPYGSVEFNSTTRNQMKYCLRSTDSVDSYPLCFLRDDCTKLNMECMDNEISISSSPNNLSEKILNMRKECQDLLKICNNRKNLPNTTRIFDSEKFNADPLNNYYGWFNEVCVDEGFGKKLRQVYAYKISGSGIFDSNTFDGKCIVMPGYTNCNLGGKMPDCPCTIYDPTKITPSHISSLDTSTYTIRTETLHEAGLCIDIKLPQTCPTIDYLKGYEPTTNDPFYLVSSINLLSASGYNNARGVHLTHQARTVGGYGNAEYSSTIAGSIAKGVCNGFWKHKTQYGEQLFPELSCTTNGTWNTTIENVNSSCERYSCPEISNPTLDNSNGLYSKNYGSFEISEDKGKNDGFAYWPKKTLNSDFAILTSATNCITGFKKVDTTMNFSYPATIDIPSSKKTLANAQIFGAVTSYSGGTTPTRICNQIGEWQNVTNSCQRISCPQINPGTTSPSNADDKKVWQKTWDISGGAKFPAINASRSSSEIITYSGIGSRQSGTCETGLGYYQPAGAVAPTMDCDHLGNWTNLQNRCLNDCSAVTRAETNMANGFAIWSTSTFSTPGVSTQKSTGRCDDIPNYFNYPYPPRRKPDGTKFDLTSSTPVDGVSISENVNNDTRSVGPPERTCTLSTYGDSTASKWSSPSSTCVTLATDDNLPNGCVSGDSSDSESLMYDERINAGVTQHQILNDSGTQITIKIPWQRRKFGTHQIRYCDSNNNYCQNFNSPSSNHNSYNYYTSSRSKVFAISRYCNGSTKKWDPPVVHCIASGDLGNSLNASVTAPATFLDGSNHNILNSAGTAAISCNSGYASASTPYIRCDSSTNLNEYKLVKNDGNNCVKYCDTNADGSFPGSSYSYVYGPGSTRFYSGNTTTGTCSGGYPCGSQTVTATCTDSGWSIPAPPCRACNGCNQDSPHNVNSDEIYTRTISYECVKERWNVKCMIENAKKKKYSGNFYRNHGEKIGFYNEKSFYACYGIAWRIGKACGAVEFTCNDGTWIYSHDLSHSWQCDKPNYNYMILMIENSEFECRESSTVWDVKKPNYDIQRPNGLYQCCMKDYDDYSKNCSDNFCGK